MLAEDKRIGDIYEQHKDEDGFLYILYSIEEPIDRGEAQENEEKACTTEQRSNVNIVSTDLVAIAAVLQNQRQRGVNHDEDHYKDCVVCRQPLMHDIVNISGCSHQFHKECIVYWSNV